jgi:hypothetical protein
MTGAPAWDGATTGSPPLAAQVNQLLFAHSVTLLYQGVQQDAQIVPGSGSASTAGGTYLAQRFTTGVSQTGLGYALAHILGGVAGFPLSLSVYASSAGAPTGSPLITVQAPSEYVAFGPAYLTFPLPLTVTANTVYFLVAAPPASGAYTWNKSNQTSGVYTSTNGTAWTAQTYGLEYLIYDQTATGPLTATWEDGGARWSWLNFGGTGLLADLSEYTTAQASGYVVSNRALSYSGTLLTGVA